MSKVKKAAWKKGYRAKIDAEKAFDELERIKDKNKGILTAGIVLNEAKSAKNPLHKQFEWDDTEAANEYRLTQSRKLIGSIEVVYEEAETLPPQRHYISISEEPLNEQPKRNVYRSTDEILQDPIARDELLANAIREALAYRKKYNGLSELSKVFKAFDDFVSKEATV